MWKLLIKHHSNEKNGVNMPIRNMVCAAELDL